MTSGQVKKNRENLQRHNSNQKTLKHKNIFLNIPKTSRKHFSNSRIANFAPWEINENEGMEIRAQKNYRAFDQNRAAELCGSYFVREIRFKIHEKVPNLQFFEWR